MITIIAGGRDIQDKGCLKKAIKLSGFNITKVVCGMARGIDLRGKRWADIRGVPVEEMPAEWDLYGRGAGFMRNEEMAIYTSEFKPDAGLLLIWDGKSKGSGNMLKNARKYGLKVSQYIKT